MFQFNNYKVVFFSISYCKVNEYIESRISKKARTIFISFHFKWIFKKLKF